MKVCKTLLAIAGATVLLSALVTTASANRISTSSQSLRATFPRVVFSGGFGANECAVTMEGSFHERTIGKVEGALTGYVTRAVIGGTHCIKGSATVLQASLPWHVRYESFSGVLPNISSIHATITGVQFNVKEPIFGVACLASGGVTTMSFNREATGVVTSAVMGGESPTSCGFNGRIEGTSNSLTVLNSTTRITVTLI